MTKLPLSGFEPANQRPSDQKPSTLPLDYGTRQDVLGYTGAISKILHWSEDILFRTCEIIGVGGYA